MSTQDLKPDPNNPAQQRIWNDSAEGISVVGRAGIEHSPEALKVLMKDGVDAYQAWLREHAHN